MYSGLFLPLLLRSSAPPLLRSSHLHTPISLRLCLCLWLLASSEEKEQLKKRLSEIDDLLPMEQPKESKKAGMAGVGRKERARERETDRQTNKLLGELRWG